MSKHLHQYKKVDIGKDIPYIVYRCMSCPHYLLPYLLEGREAKCPRCGEAFTIKKDHLTLANPHCDNCTVRKEREIA